jgi:hypothetical protein
MEGREHMIKNEINILKRVSQGNKNILSLVDYFETLNNCKLNSYKKEYFEILTVFFYQCTL